MKLMIFMSRRYKHTHFQAYFVCLLLANTMQAWGTTISLKWVLVGAIEDDSKCAMQGTFQDTVGWRKMQSKVLHYESSDCLDFVFCA
jgi:hypothetical protein